jgi:peptidoglycan/xylan/chitin deacetylase (PgdA/CDA1 family)
LEIRDCRHKLQDWSGQDVRYFSFPYGLQSNMSQAAVDTVYEAGFDGFVSAYGAWNFVGNDYFHIRRIHAVREIELLQNWLTLDPRKIYWEQTYAYVDPTTNPALQASQHTNHLPVIAANDSHGMNPQSESCVS